MKGNEERMKVTMLGTSGSGKTVYMSAMSQLLFHGRINGYGLKSRDNTPEGNAFTNIHIEDINSLYESGKFPSGTSKNTLMALELVRNGEHIMDIDWIDYRGGAIKDIILGNVTQENSEVRATLLASDVIMVFVDSSILKATPNDIFVRSRVGANYISQLLSYIVERKHVNIMFLLSKADSSNVNIKQDLAELTERIERIYSRFFSDTCTDISQYPVIPVGAVGIGNVKSSQTWESNNNGTQLISKHEIIAFSNMNTYKIAASFAKALLLCLDSEINRKNTETPLLAKELENLTKDFGPAKNAIDMLFFGSQRRGRIHDLKQMIEENRNEIRRLQPHRANLQRIASRSV